MKHTNLGKSGLDVSRIAFGTWQLGGDWGPTDTGGSDGRHPPGRRRRRHVLRHGSGLRVRPVRAAPGGGLRHLRRQDVVIATKGGLRPEGTGVVRDASSAWIRQGVEASLRALDTDYVDLYQVHWPDPATPFEETADVLGKLVADGKILHVGVSNFDVEQMEAFSVTLPIETLQPPYHLFRREIEAEVLPYTAANDIGVVVYGPLAHGLLSGHLTVETEFDPADWRSKSSVFHGASFERNLRAVDLLRQLAEGELGITLPQLAVAWTLHNPAVDVAIVGTRDPAHVDEALVAADIVLDDEVMQRIDQIMIGAVPVGGPSPEGM